MIGGRPCQMKTLSKSVIQRLPLVQAELRAYLDDHARQSPFQALETSKLVILFDKDPQSVLVADDGDLVRLDSQFRSVDQRPLDVIEGKLELLEHEGSAALL